jgi:hypothetical protein
MTEDLAPPLPPCMVFSCDTKAINPSLEEYQAMDDLAHKLYDLGYNRVFIDKSSDSEFKLVLTIANDKMDSGFIMEKGNIEGVLESMREMIKGIEHKQEIENGW